VGGSVLLLEQFRESFPDLISCSVIYDFLSEFLEEWLGCWMEPPLLPHIPLPLGWERSQMVAQVNYLLLAHLQYITPVGTTKLLSLLPSECHLPISIPKISLVSPVTEYVCPIGSFSFVTAFLTFYLTRKCSGTSVLCF
jgi:hypothetical protein